MQGSNSIDTTQFSQYDGVKGRSVSTYDATIPSGETIIGGIRFNWVAPDEVIGDNYGGFVGISWYHDFEGGPTNVYKFNSEEDVYNYVKTNNNLNDVFKKWSEHLDSLGDNWNIIYTAFVDKVGGTCAVKEW